MFGYESQPLLPLVARESCSEEGLAKHQTRSMAEYPLESFHFIDFVSIFL